MEPGDFIHQWPFSLVEDYPAGQYLPHTFGLLLQMNQAIPTASWESLEAERKHKQAWSGMRSAWPWACLELPTTAVSEIRDQGMFYEVPKMLSINYLIAYWRWILPPQGFCALKFPSSLWHLLHAVFNCIHSYMCINSPDGLQVPGGQWPHWTEPFRPLCWPFGKALSVILAEWGKKLLDPRHCNLSLKLSFKKEL